MEIPLEQKQPPGNPLAVALIMVSQSLGRAISRRCGFSPLVLASFAVLAAAAAITLGLPEAGVAKSSQPAHQVAIGAWIPNSFEHPNSIDRYARQVGRRPVIVSRYPNWSTPPFTREALSAIWRRGAVPLVTWEPWSSAGRGFPLRAIANGRYDGYVRRSARAAAAWGKPILLRFAHEMNGNWYPWGTGHGNTPALYKRAWRHLVGIFRAAGADNVEWVWAPNVDEQGGSPIVLPLIGSGPSHPFPFRKFYPGDRWVDWVGLDGFNWGKGGTWQSFTEIFGSSYDTLIRMTSRPMIITETASNERIGDKAAWVSSALSDEIPRFSRIRAVVWFDEPFNGVDGRVDSSSASLQAFRSALASPIYGLSRSAFLATPASLPMGSPAPAPPGGGFGRASFIERAWIQVRRHRLWVAIAILGGAAILGASIWTITNRAQRRGER